MSISRTKYKGISKVDRPDHHMQGYIVRVQWKKQLRQKFCSIVQHGDWMAALDAAIEFRAKAEEELGKPRTEQLIVGTTRGTRSGIRGVRIFTVGDVEYAEASWVDQNGKKHGTRFSINRHGRKKAIKLAQQARERGETERRTYPRRKNGQVVQPVLVEAAAPAPVAPPVVPSSKPAAPRDRFDELLARVHAMG